MRHPRPPPPPPPLRRFHSRAPSSAADCVSLLDEITGSLPTMDPSQPMPFPESNYTEEEYDSSDDVQQEPHRRRGKRGAGTGCNGSRAKGGDNYRVVRLDLTPEIEVQRYSSN